MSQEDKPELCGALAENGFCTMPKGHNMGRLDIPSNHKSEPVAAQEPVANPYKNADSGLYGEEYTKQAAPCDRCADAEQLHYKEMAERTVQEEFLLAALADLEADGFSSAVWCEVLDDQLSSFEETVDKPVAAQEPIAWRTDDYLTDKSATTYDHNVVERWKDRGWPVVPLYDHAAPCADPIAWRNIASPNGLRRFMTQKQYDANPNLQKYYEPFTCARCAELEALYSKLDEHCSAGWDKCDELKAKITEQAEELRIVRANEAQLEKDFDRRNEVVDAQAERIKALEAESESLRSSAIDQVLALSDEQVVALCRIEGNNPEDVATIGKQCFEIALLKAEKAKADAVILKVKSVLTSIAEYANAAAIHNARYALAAIEQYQKGE